MKKLTDPKTKAATAFYAALAACLADVFHRGFNWYSAALLGLMSGVLTLGTLALLLGKDPPEDPPGEPPTPV